ncbi:terminase large subunit [Clostridium butyricum]|uniref:terminase large subunit n=1 Tax=Clostridium butyricum TaxID=1492 RepID=UPI002AB17A59|nr:terminase TerL endonuclease subunit [Clostridium butyricum]
MRLLDLSIEYAEDVISGKELAPDEVKIQCEWFLRDLELQNDEDFKYYFAYDKLQIVENLLKLFNFATGLGVVGKSILDGLHPFQAFFITNIFGWRFKDDESRFKHRDITMFIPRKNAKTFLVAVILLLLLLTEDDYSEFYSICLDRELASEVKKAMSQILSASPLVNKYFKVPKSLNGKVLCTITNSFYQPRTATANANNAIRPSAFISDEVGAFTSYDNINAMKSGQLSVRNPLRFKLTTAYAEDKSIMLQELEYIRKVYKGIIEDERQFALLYYASEDHLWDEEGLYMSNPLRIEANYNEIRDNRKKALENKGEEAEYLTKNMNHFMPSIITEAFVDIDKVKKCVVDKDTIDWQNRDVFVGVDLSMTTDLTSVSMVSYDEEAEEIYAKSWAFIPENKINEQSLKQKVDYYKEIQLGNCFACGEDVIDYGFVEEFIMSLEEKHGVNVIQIGFDRYNAMSSMAKIERQGYTVVEVIQHSKHLNSSVKLLEESILNSKFKFEENDLYLGQFANVKVTYDNAMNKWIKKKIATGKIDCIVSTINALFLLNVALIDSIGDGFIVGVY